MGVLRRIDILLGRIGFLLRRIAIVLWCRNSVLLRGRISSILRRIDFLLGRRIGFLLRRRIGFLLRRRIWFPSSEDCRPCSAEVRYPSVEEGWLLSLEEDSFPSSAQPLSLSGNLCQPSVQNDLPSPEWYSSSWEDEIEGPSVAPVLSVA